MIRIFFLSQSSPILELFPFDKITLKSYICTVVTVMAKQCWSQTVLESGSWGHSVLQTPALVFFFLCFLFAMLGLLPHRVRCLTTAPCQATFCHVRLIIAPYQVLQSRHAGRRFFFFFFVFFFLFCFFYVRLITSPCLVFNSCALSGNFLLLL